MKRLITIVCLLIVSCVSTSAIAASQYDKFISEIVAKTTQAENAGQSVVAGKDGWLFFVPELRSMSAGRFWGDAAAKVNTTSNPAYADPIPAILDFKKQLDKAKISLIMVPVPAKCIIYPDYITNVSTPVTRMDPNHQEFYKILKTNGINVLDLVPSFLKNRNGKLGPLYCKQDTHWSGLGCVLTADLITVEIRKQAWFKAVPKKQFVKQDSKTTIKGDLLEALADPSVKPETILLSTVKQKTPAGLIPVADWRQSPVLLLGDSHNLIFHSGDDMQAQGAGLADQLAAQLGFPVDVVAVRGSGATPARLNLMRRKDNMKGKKLLIWCFSVREFTEGQGWRKVPIIK